MPDDVGGQPFQDGEEPEFHHGDADEEFASVVFDEDFVRAAEVHEPTAAERILAAAQSHAENEPPRGFEDGYGYGRRGAKREPGAEADEEPDEEDLDDEEGRFDRSDYAEYADYADFGDDPEDDGDDPEGRYGHHGHYGQFGRHGRFTGRYAPYAHDYGPHPDPAFEHGSDYGYAYEVPGRPPRPYRGHARWQRPVAWVLAVIMGIGMVALAFSAVYRGNAHQRQDPAPPPATTGVGTSTGEDPETGADGDGRGEGDGSGEGGVAPKAELGAEPGTDGHGDLGTETGAPAASAEPR